MNNDDQIWSKAEVEAVEIGLAEQAETISILRAERDKLAHSLERANNALDDALQIDIAARAEMARLKAINAELVGALEIIVNEYDSCDDYNSDGRAAELVNEELRKALAKAKES